MISGLFQRNWHGQFATECTSNTTQQVVLDNPGTSREGISSRHDNNAASCDYTETA